MHEISEFKQFNASDHPVKCLCCGAEPDHDVLAMNAVSLGRAMILNPSLANTWLSDAGGDPTFPMFDAPPRGGVTAWYSMRLTARGENEEDQFDLSPAEALEMSTRGTRNVARPGLSGSVDQVPLEKLIFLPSAAFKCLASVWAQT